MKIEIQIFLLITISVFTQSFNIHNSINKRNIGIKTEIKMSNKYFESYKNPDKKYIKQNFKIFDDTEPLYTIVGKKTKLFEEIIDELDKQKMKYFEIIINDVDYVKPIIYEDENEIHIFDFYFIIYRKKNFSLCFM